MARITTEDCVARVPNRFELVLMAAQRAREIGRGAAPTVAADGEPRTVVALREIAAGTVDPSRLRDALVAGFQRSRPEEAPEEPPSPPAVKAS